MPKRIKVIFPVPMNEHTRELVESQIPPEFIAPGFECQFVGSKRLATLAQSYYDMAIMDMIVLEAGMQAEAEGFDAVCINPVSDSALYALRARLTIPSQPGIFKNMLTSTIFSSGHSSTSTSPR